MTPSARLWVARWVQWCGAGLCALGSLLPWATVFGISAAGTSGDGVITLIAGLAVGGLAFAYPRRWAAVVSLLAALVAMGTALYDTIHISGTIASVGYGLFLTDVAAAACIVSACLALTQQAIVVPPLPSVAYSSDGRFWWDGYRWVPVGPYQPSPPTWGGGSGGPLT
jgi:hypothetical protein